MQDSDALNWFLSPCIIPCTTAAQGPRSVITLSRSVFLTLTEQYDLLGRVLNIYLPTDSGLDIYIYFWIPDERELEPGTLKTELGENIISLCTFLPSLHYFRHFFFFFQRGISFVHSFVVSYGLMIESEEELKSLLMRVKEESEKACLKLNIEKLFLSLLSHFLLHGPWCFWGAEWGWEIFISIWSSVRLWIGYCRG